MGSCASKTEGPLTKTLVVYGSANGDASVSRKVAESLLKKLGVSESETTVKDFSKDAPIFVDGNWVAARFNPEATIPTYTQLGSTSRRRFRRRWCPG